LFAEVPERLRPESGMSHLGGHRAFSFGVTTSFLRHLYKPDGPVIVSNN